MSDPRPPGGPGARPPSWTNPTDPAPGGGRPRIEPPYPSGAGERPLAPASAPPAASGGVRAPMPEGPATTPISSSSGQGSASAPSAVPPPAATPSPTPPAAASPPAYAPDYVRAGSAPPGRGGVGRPLVIGAVLAVLLGVLAALFLRPGTRERPRDDSAAVAANAERETGRGDEDGPAFGVAATREPYRAPDRQAVRDAYAQVGRVYQAEGVSGLARFGQECFRGLERASTYRDLDFCLAFDAFGAAITQRVSGGAPAAPDSYYGGTAARHQQVAQAVMGSQGDASARLIDIRRLAIEVARESGPAVRTGPSIAAREPPSPPAAVPERPTSSPPVIVYDQPPRSPSTTPPADVDRDLGAPVPFQVPVQVPVPSASEVAAARPARGGGPSFDCRRAVQQSERIVCADPALAALDRRLNAAYEDAIAAGADRRALRLEQDRWLALREAAAPDPRAVSDAYRRRIRELDAMP